MNVTPASVTNIVLQLGDPVNYYPLTGTAFVEFTDTLSVAQNDPLYCPKSYNVTIEPANVLTTFVFDATTKKF